MGHKNEDTPKTEDQQTEKPVQPVEEIPQDAWDKFDDLMDKVLGTEQQEPPAQVG